MEKDLERRKPIKIVLVGPESTGKTTLAQLLAAHFNTTWAREFLREFAEWKLLQEDKTIYYSDQKTIVEGQIRLEKEAEIKANTFVFCDTNIIQTRLYSELYFKKVPEYLESISGECDLYILTDIDVEWEKDHVRDAKHERENHINYFKKRLTELKKPFLFISGSEQERLEKTIEWCVELKKTLDKGLTVENFIENQKAKPTQK